MEASPCANGECRHISSALYPLCAKSAFFSARNRRIRMVIFGTIPPLSDRAKWRVGSPKGVYEVRC